MQHIKSVALCLVATAIAIVFLSPIRASAPQQAASICCGGGLGIDQSILLGLSSGDRTAGPGLVDRPGTDAISGTLYANRAGGGTTSQVFAQNLGNTTVTIGTTSSGNLQIAPGESSALLFINNENDQVTWSSSAGGTRCKFAWTVQYGLPR